VRYSNVAAREGQMSEPRSTDAGDSTGHPPAHPFTPLEIGGAPGHEARLTDWCAYRPSDAEYVCGYLAGDPVHITPASPSPAVGPVFGRTAYGSSRHAVRPGRAGGWPAAARCGVELVGPAADRHSTLCGMCERSLVAEEDRARRAPDGPIGDPAPERPWAATATVACACAGIYGCATCQAMWRAC